MLEGEGVFVYFEDNAGIIVSDHVEMEGSAIVLALNALNNEGFLNWYRRSWLRIH